MCCPAHPRRRTAREAKHDLQAAEQDSGESEHNQMRHSSMVKTLGRMLHMEPEQAAKTFEFINFAILVAAIGYGSGHIAAQGLPQPHQQH